MIIEHRLHSTNSNEFDSILIGTILFYCFLSCLENTKCHRQHILETLTGTSGKPSVRNLFVQQQWLQRGS